jgi:hypothetical protein
MSLWLVLRFDYCVVLYKSLVIFVPLLSGFVTLYFSLEHFLSQWMFLLFYLGSSVLLNMICDQKVCNFVVMIVLVVL